MSTLRVADMSRAVHPALSAGEPVSRSKAEPDIVVWRHAILSDPVQLVVRVARRVASSCRAPASCEP
jgi:hypothetical protein